MSSACREPGTCMLCYSMYLQVVKVHLFNYSISQVTYVHSSRTTNKSLYFRLLQKTKTLSRANADFDFQTATQGHLVRSDFFCKDLQTKIWILRVKKLRNSERTHTHTRARTHTPRSADALWFSRKDVHAPVPPPSLSLSLFTFAKTVWIQIPNGIQERIFRQFKNLRMR